MVKQPGKSTLVVLLPNEALSCARPLLGLEELTMDGLTVDEWNAVERLPLRTVTAASSGTAVVIDTMAVSALINPTGRHRRLPSSGILSAGASQWCHS